MRKKSREMPASWAADIMRRSPYITLSFCLPDGRPYAVPLSLAAEEESTITVSDADASPTDETGTAAPATLPKPNAAAASTTAANVPSTWYFHCADEGLKLSAIEACPDVCLTAVTQCRPTVGPKDGSFTMQYRSATAFARATIVTDPAEKHRALELISRRFLPQHMEAFEAACQRSMNRTTVVRLDLTAPPTGKRKEYAPDGTELKWGAMP